MMEELTLPDILLVTHRVPYPPDKGDRIRTYHILKFLASRARVHLASLADEPVNIETLMVLKGYCHRVALAPIGGMGRWGRGMWSMARGRTISEGMFASRPLTNTIRSWCKDAEFYGSVASASSVAQYLQLPPLERVPAIVDLVDVDSQKWFDYAVRSPWHKAWIYRQEGRRLRALERQITDWAKAVMLVSEGEADLFRQITPRMNVHAVTNGVDLEYYQPLHGMPENGCVFVGDLSYKPNIDAAEWFSREIWPAVHHRFPNARLRIVGRQPSKTVQALMQIPGVDVVGQVPDIRPFVASGAIVVAPLRIARGLQNKVLEAMAMAKPVIASPHALAGFRKNEVPACCATTSPEWIDQICRLLDDVSTRRDLGRAGRRFAEEYHHWETCLKPLGQLLDLPEDWFSQNRTPASLVETRW